MAKRKLYCKPDITAAELADELGISERRLTYTILNAYDKTVTEYLNDRRIQAACRMLREQQDKRMEDICVSDSHHCRPFRTGSNAPWDKLLSNTAK